MTAPADLSAIPVERTAAQLFLREHEPFRSMDEAALQQLISQLSLVYYPKGSVLLSPALPEEDCFFIVKQGAVLGEQPVSGVAEEPESIWWLTEGECFPLGALLLQRPVAGLYRAGADTFCYRLPGALFRELVRQSPVFADFCTRRLANLLEASKRSLQAEYASAAREQVSMQTSLKTLLRREPVSCPPHTPTYRVMEEMDRRRIGAMIIVSTDQQPVGLFTLQDVLHRVAVPQADPTQPISVVMTPEPVVLPATATVLDATLSMARLGVRHVLVAEGGRVIGLVSERDLFALQRTSVRQISQAIRQAGGQDELIQASRDIRALAHNLLAQGVVAEHLTQIVSALNDVLIEQVLDLFLRSAVPAGVDYCWLAFGSEGRMEQTLAAGQRNGLVFVAPAGQDDESVRRVLLPLAQQVNQVLAAAGFPLCRDRVMAGDPGCCLSLTEWQQRFGHWTAAPEQQSLSDFALYFDVRPVYGNRTLAERLSDTIRRQAKEAKGFLPALLESTRERRPPLTFFGEIAVPDSGAEAGLLDLKLHGARPFVDAARWLALRGNIDDTHTVGRLRAAGGVWGLEPQTVAAWVDAFHFIQLLRLRLHHRQAEQGLPLANLIDPDELNDLDRRIVKEAFRQGRKLQNMLPKLVQII